MSELEKREDLSRFDSKSTEELQEILHKHTHGELETEPDTQDLFAIMEVLSTRRQQQNPQVFRSDEEALAEFRKHYMPKESKAVTQHKTMKFPSRLLRTIAAVLAVVLILTAGTTITAKAFNYDIWRKLGSWTKEFFQFAEVSGPGIAEPDQTDAIEYRQLYDALAEFGIRKKVTPSWLPEGYTHKDIMVMDSPKEISIHAVYEYQGVELIIRIRQVIDGKADQLEKNDDLLEIYVANDIEYYIFSNNTKLQATWVVEEFECFIIGSITVEEIKAMIDSI